MKIPILSMTIHSTRAALVYFIFFLSGACGLVYQVTWIRIMTQVFGTTTFAVSTILTTFMGGLAAGSYFLGRIADGKGNPLKQYGLMEIGIGLSALGTLWIMDRMTPLYLWFFFQFGYSFTGVSILRFFLTMCLLIVPTTLMGATLPILSRYFIREMNVLGRNLSSLYAMNTTGAIAGGLITGFYLIGKLGIHPTIYLAALVNIILGFISLILSRFEISTSNERPAPSRFQEKPFLANPVKNNISSRIIILWAFGVSGFTSFGYEVLWTRSFQLMVGNSTYAFVTILVAFLAGVAIGSLSVKRFADRLKSPLLVFGIVEITIAMTALIALPSLEAIFFSGLVQDWIIVNKGSWVATLFIKFGTAFFLTLIPTVLIGATFPLAGRIYVRSLDRVGEQVGKIYAVNTIGNILGAFLAGFVFLPLLGIHNSIALLTLCNLLIGILAILNAEPVHRYAKLSFSALGVGTFVIFFAILSLMGPPHSGREKKGERVLFYEEGVAATVKVTEDLVRGVKSISVDGTGVGGTNPESDLKQQILAHLPFLLKNDIKSTLSIGLGSGILLGQITNHSEVLKVDCVEISSGVIQGANYFSGENEDLARNKKVNIILDDGINYLLTTNYSYDLIASDAKNKPEFSGTGAFYSREYYELARNHLNPDGIMIQWVPLYLPPEDYKTVLRTFSGAFPHIYVWFTPLLHSFLIGTTTPLSVDYDFVNTQLQKKEFAGLHRYGIVNPDDFMGFFVSGRNSIIKAVGTGDINSMERPVIEFYSLKDYAVDQTVRSGLNIKFILELWKESGDNMALKFSRVDDVANSQRVVKAIQKFLEGFQLFLLKTSPWEDISKIFGEAINAARDIPSARYALSQYFIESGKDFFAKENYPNAMRTLQTAVHLWEGQTEGHYYLGLLYKWGGALEPAALEFKTALEQKPDYIRARLVLAETYEMQGRYPDAVVEYERIIKSDPNNVEVLNNLGCLMGENKETLEDGLIHIKKAHEIEPRNASIMDSLAWLYFKKGDMLLAREMIQKAARYGPQNKNIKSHFETIMGR